MGKMQMSAREIGLRLDEAFNGKMRIAKFLLKDLVDKEDAKIAAKWMLRVSAIKSANLEVKKNRNDFLSYLIKVLGDGVLQSCPGFRMDTVCQPDDGLAFLNNLDEYAGSSCEACIEDEALEEEEPRRPRFHSRWSKDYRTYIAVQSIPGEGALLYMAVSKLPGLRNWELPLS